MSLRTRLFRLFALTSVVFPRQRITSLPEECGRQNPTLFLGINGACHEPSNSKEHALTLAPSAIRRLHVMYIALTFLDNVTCEYRSEYYVQFS